MSDRFFAIIEQEDGTYALHRRVGNCIDEPILHGAYENIDAIEDELSQALLWVVKNGWTVCRRGQSTRLSCADC